MYIKQFNKHWEKDFKWNFLDTEIIPLWEILKSNKKKLQN